MPQKRQTDEQRLLEIEESDRLLEEQGFGATRDNMADDDPEGMDEFWEEQLTEMMRKQKRRPAR